MKGIEQLADVYKLSPMQEAMLFHSLMNKDSHAYSWQTLLSLRGDVDREVLEKSINRVIRKYDVLRTVFHYEGLKEPLQIVLKERRLKVDYRDISHLDEVEKETWVYEFCRKDREKGFDLSKDLLIKISLFKTGPSAYKLVWSSHHIIMDGWCLGILFGDIFKFYGSLLHGGIEDGKMIGPIPVVPYRHYIEWLEKQDKEKGLVYWREYLDGYGRPAVLPIVGVFGAETRTPGYDRKGITFDINISLINGINNLAAREQMPPAIIWQTLWGVLLQKYNNTDDVVFGLVVTVRPPEIKGIERMVGLFINTIPIRVKMEDNSTFKQLIHPIYMQSIQSKEVNYLPLAEIQTQSLLRNRLFNQLMALQNYPFEENLVHLGSENEIGFRIETAENFDVADYAFNIIITPAGSGNVTFSFDGNIYEKNMVRRLGGHFFYLMQQAIEQPETTIAALDIVTSKEKEQILFDFNQNDTCTDQDGFLDRTLHGLFADRVEKVPDNIAVFCSRRTRVKAEEKKRRREEEKIEAGVHLSYRQLAEKSDWLAYMLIKKGITIDNIVAVIIERSVEMIITIIGILKAGGAYLPIDPEYPQNRIEYMLKDSGAKMVLGRAEKEGRAEDFASSLPRFLASYSSGLAYVIYTSGTTGKAKGVAVEHRNALNTVNWFVNIHKVGIETRIIQLSDYTFDASVNQIFGALISGAGLYVAVKELRADIKKLRDYIINHRINIINFVPILLKELLGDVDKLGCLHTVISGAEKLDEITKEAIIRRGYRLVNQYGPTETTIDALASECSAKERVSLGKPIFNVKVYILNSYEQIVPIGVMGELCIAGAGVARGYLNNPEITAEKFKKFNRSYRTYKSSILYKTGDLARWLENGKIELMGRLDFQVKVRGYRIELEEIEAHLLACPGIIEAVVVVRDNRFSDESFICAYYVGNGVGIIEIKEYLSRFLPQYMIPDRYIQLERLPLSPTGKVNRDALPEPEVMSTGSAGGQPGYVAPANEMEEKLVAIWADVLRLDKKLIGTADNFFMLGGHSLKITMVAGRIYKELGVKVTPAELFENPYISQLARYIGGIPRQLYFGIEAIEKREYYPISLAQQRFYMLQQMAPDSLAYNMPQVMELSGDVDETKLEKVFSEIIQCHESLRTSFELVDNQLVQRVHESVEFKIEVFGGPGTFFQKGPWPPEAIIKSFVRPFDLSCAPLFRAALIKMLAGKYIMMVDMHHIICDGVSHGILADQFQALYRGEELPRMRFQYRDFSQWQSDLLVSGGMAEAEKYWLSLLKDKLSRPGISPISTMLMDYPRPKKQSFVGKNFSFHSGIELASRVNQLARQTNTTLYMILLAVFNILLSRYSGQTDIIIGSPVAGRAHPDLESVIGLVMATMAMRNQPMGNKTFRDFLEEVKINTLKAYQYQAYPFEALLERANFAEDELSGRNPFFDVSLVVQNFADDRSKTFKIKNNSALKIIPYAFEYGETAKMDLTFFAREQEKDIIFNLEYCTDLFKPATMERLSRHFLNLLLEVVELPNQRIEDFNLQGRDGKLGTFRCFIIGESTLPTRAAEILMRYGHRVLGIISDDSQVIAWCREKNIAFTGFNKTTIKAFLSRTFDYLLSINNGHILPPEILSMPKKGAINFHDSPLPRGAGLYATTWAIMEQESRHAVTWHEMDNGIDTGAILIQKSVEIEPGETAGSLNMKCYEAAVSSFETLVSQWEEGGPVLCPQDLAKRTYNSLSRRPFAAGVINFNQPAVMIDAFVRSLDFGDYPNPLAVPKFLIGSDFFTVHEVFLTENETNCTNLPGVLTRINHDISGVPSSLFVATAGGELEIRNIFTLEGLAIQLSDLVIQKSLVPGKVLGTMDEVIARRVDQLNRAVSRYEHHWLERLHSLQPLAFPFTSGIQKHNVAIMTVPLTVPQLSLPEKIQFQQISPSQAEKMAIVFWVWLCRITNQYTFDTGWNEPVLHQHINGLENLFAVPVPLRIDLNPELTFGECAQILHAELKRLRKWKTFCRDIFQRFPHLPATNASGDLEKTTACGVMILNNLDTLLPDFVPCFYLAISENGDECLWLYNKERFSEENIQQLWHHFSVFSQSVLANPSLQMRQHSLLDEEDRYYQLYRLNDTEMKFSQVQAGQVVHRMFEAQAERTPNHTALIIPPDDIENMDSNSMAIRMSYRELNVKADRLAGLLRQKGINNGDLVGILADRSAEVVEAMLAVLKAGGAYLPIDPEYPQERVNYILRDSAARILIIKSEIRNPKFETNSNDQKINAPNKNDEAPFVLDLSHLDFGFVSFFEFRASNLNSSNLAYIIYTSGSTGNPKGVAVTHGNLATYIQAFEHGFNLQETDTVLQQASSSFDTFAEEMYPILLKGGSLAIAGKERVRDIQLLVRFIEEYCVTIISCSPQLLSLLNSVASNDSDMSPHPLRSVHTFISGGDVLKWEHVDRLLDIAGVYNTYGPTETTICATFFRCSRNEWSRGLNVPMGCPIANYNVYLFDGNMELVPVGLLGEIYIAGPGVSAGYLNRPELTAEKFNRFYRSSRSHKTYIFKTGDLARWLPGGVLEFIGRVDQQVKIRGFRIELAEIEKCLMLREDIKDAVVVDNLDQNGDLYLCAYIVGRKFLPLTSHELRDYLSAFLPEYMVPSYFVSIDKLPLTSHGKIDRRALPEPQSQWNGEVLQGGVGCSPMEKKLAQIWSEVLGIDEKLIGITSNFFQLGGHSLKATIMITKVHNVFQVNLPLAEVFKRPYIEALCQYIGQSRKTIYNSIEVVEDTEEGFYPLSSAQKRIFFLEQLEDIGTSYNMPFFFIIEGNLDEERFEDSLKFLIKRHESLRTSFHLVDSQPVQRIHNLGATDVASEHGETRTLIKVFGSPGTFFQKGSWPPEAIIKSFIQPFDLSKAPLLRVGIIELSEQGHLVLFDMHHIIADGTSMGILIKEFSRVYNGEAEQLPGLRIQYKDFAVWQNRLYKSGKIQEQEEYWLEQFKDQRNIPLLNMPTDYPRPEILSFAGDVYDFSLGAEETARFKRFIQLSGITLYIGLNAVFNLLLHKYTGQDDIIVGTGIAGRHQADLQEIIGMFVNTLAIRTSPCNYITCLEYLEEVKEITLGAFENQDLQFEELVDRLNLERNPSHNPLFDVCLVVQNFARPPLDLKGLNVKSYPYQKHTAKFDMTLFVFEKEDGIEFQLEYSTRLFKPGTIGRLAGHLKTILLQFQETPVLLISRIDMVTRAEKEELLYRFNDTDVPYEMDRTIHDLFAEQVQRTPDRIAIAGQREMLTYWELNKKAGQLAGYLFYGKGVRPNDRVAILMDRSMEMIIVIVGVLKAGAAYLPLDPALPMKRIKTIIMDAGPGVIISQKRFMRMLLRLQWSCPLPNSSFHSFLCMDTWNIYEEMETERQELVEPHLWDYVAEKGTDDIIAGGWISSYTGQPFSRAEMEEYSENIFKKLRTLLHKNTRVLEIGISSGITMYRIAPAVGFYCGTDISEVIIRGNRERVRREGNTHISLFCLAAHEIDQLNEKDFDLVIINSVIQAFPGHNYLRQVLAKCLELLKPKAHLFIGDVMNQDLEAALIQEMEDFKRNPVNKGKNYKTKTDFSAELFISPGYFEDLVADLPGIIKVQCTPKIYSIANELTRFRYDALLTVDKASREKGKLQQRSKFQDDLRSLEIYGSTAAMPMVTSRDLAYLIFTSGTTGKPKGVMIEHCGIVNLNLFFKTGIGITENDRVLQFANMAFDASIWEIFSALFNGAALYMLTSAIIGDYAAFEKYLEECGITVMTLPPPFLVHLLPEKISSLRVLVSAGSEIDRILLERWREKVRVINAYGPTESTICATAWEALEITQSHYVIPIGNPLANIRVYILDQIGYLQPVGVPGELCIAGVGVARGYLNNPEITAEKFNRSHRTYKTYRTHRTHMTYILYKTGDWARWLEHGNIEFLGRIDQQVKIRGFRLEPAEIENCLLRHENVLEAVVLARENEQGETYLCAYIVISRVGDGDISMLREYLAGYLPDYMIPAYFVRVDNIPLTVNGKIDTEALPAPTKSIIYGEYTPPQNDVERKLAAIWADVLSIKKEIISREAGFFDLGGHSLNAITMIARVHKEMGIKIPLIQVFKSQTIAELALYIKEAPREIFAAIRPAPHREFYPLSSAQKRLYLLQQLLNSGSGIAYNITTVVTLEGKLDEERLRLVFKKLIMRHDSLRTSFQEVAGELVQKIHDDVEFEIEFKKLSTDYTDYTDEKDMTFHYLSFIHHFNRAFNLSKAPLMRVGLIEIAREKYMMAVDLHHIISDGVSQGILIKEFAALYKGDNLLPLRLQYKDYSWWQQCLQQDRGKNNLLKQQEEYWMSQFQEEIQVLNLYPDYPRPPLQDFCGKTEAFSLDLETSQALLKLAGEECSGVTLFMVVLSIYTIALSIFSGQEDIIVGVPVAGRRHTDLESIVGIFINTLALRNYPCGEKSFRVFLEEVKLQTIKGFENQDYPFDELVDQISLSGRIHRDTGRHPLFDVIFGFQNEPIPPVELPELKIKPYDYETGIARFDLALFSSENIGQLHFSIEYTTSLFKLETIERFIKCFRGIIASVLADPGQRLGEIDIISPAEKELILIAFNRNDNGTGYRYDSYDRTLHELFEEHVEREANRTALIFSHSHLTYEELNKQAGRLVGILQWKGVKSGTIVGLILGRSVEMIVGIMGILKGGGAYLPIDPGTPWKRIVTMLADSNTSIVLTTASIMQELNAPPEGKIAGNFAGEILLMEFLANIPDQGVKESHCSSRPDDPAYVIYTSGSTGQAKGILTTHENVLRVVWNSNYIDLTTADRILQLSNYAFDGSIFDIYGALVNGAALVMVRRHELAALDLLCNLIEKENISVFFITTALFNALVDLRINCLDHVRKVVFGGERVSVEHARKALAHMGKGKILQIYGPTETTVFATCYPVDEIREQQGTIPVGKPISGTTAFIVDKYMRLLPVGLVGELYIGGLCVAQGYLNNPELTTEKFKFNWSYKSYKTYILYKTGDLTRWLNDGNIEFVGRIDQQVKIRGFRIEPGEIECQLLKHPSVKEAIIMVRGRETKNEDKYLCAYIVMDVVRPVKIQELKEFLSRTLPDYMVPAFFVELAALPVTANGKIDMKNLPEPRGIVNEDRDLPIYDAVEKKLAQIWSELLGIAKEKIRSNDDFFELGGHSLSAAMLSPRVHKEFNVKIPLVEIFKTPTIKGIAKYIRQSEEIPFAIVEPVEEKEYYAVSSLQERLFILDQLENAGTAYHLPYMLMVEGKLNEQEIENAFRCLIERHESLRTSFILVDGKPVQRIYKVVDFKIEYKNLSTDYTDYTDEKDFMLRHSSFIIHHFSRPFDLSRAPLLRVGLARIEEEKHLLMVDLHHIIADGTSITLLVKDFAAFYQGQLLEPLRIRYRDFSEWQQKEQEVIAKQRNWWLESFKGKIPQLNLLTDYPRPAIQSFKGESLHFVFEKELKERIGRLMKETGATLYMILLACLNVLLFRYTGDEDIVIGTAAAGREHVDFQKVIGLFINALAMRNFPAGHKTFGQFLEEVKQNTLAAFQNQAFPYGRLLEALHLKKDAARNPLFDVELVVQNMEKAHLEAKGLRFSSYMYNSQVTQVDLGFYVTEVKGRIHFNLSYRTDLFKPETIGRLAGYFKEVVTAILENPGIKLKDIAISHSLEQAEFNQFEDDNDEFGF